MGKIVAKKIIYHILKVLVLTILILCSYSYIEKHSLIQQVQKWVDDTANQYLSPKDQRTGSDSLSEFMTCFKTSAKESSSVLLNSSKLNYRAVWLSYIEFMEYLESVEENTEKNFRDIPKTAKCLLPTAVQARLSAL